MNLLYILAAVLIFFGLGLTAILIKVFIGRFIYEWRRAKRLETLRNEDNGAMVAHGPTLKGRIIGALGYRWGVNPDMDDLVEAPGYAPGYASAEVIAIFDIQDRIRILFGGVVIVRLCLKTDKPIGKMHTRSAIGVPWMERKHIPAPRFEKDKQQPPEYKPAPPPAPPNKR